MTTFPAVIEVQLRATLARLVLTAPSRGVLAIEQDGETTKYLAAEKNCERGREFRLTKFDGEGRYTVYLPSQEAEASGDCWPSCDCPAGQSLGVCKHREAVQAVVDRGAFAPIANQ